jgi:hypothetical protein
VNVVITQSMLFPWVGLLEQLKIADVIVHYDDVQFSKGSFTNRVQVKLPTGTSWMTIPLKSHKLGQNIDELEVQAAGSWAAAHLRLLSTSFSDAPFSADALRIARETYELSKPRLADVARRSLLALASYFGILDGKQLVSSSDLGITGSSSMRVFDIVRAVGGTTYVTGHGARNYLDHEIFERAGCEIRYMQYRCLPYPQSWGAFTPYVTGLDLIAHCGPAGGEWIAPKTVSWREFTGSPKKSNSTDPLIQPSTASTLSSNS